MAELIETIKDLLKEPKLRDDFAQASGPDEASSLLVAAGAKAGHDFTAQDVHEAIGKVLPPKDELPEADRHKIDITPSVGCWNTYMHSEMICNSRLCG